MSMPASSWIFSASNVASRLPSARASPSRRHAAHSLRGSASQDGFGRLPAIVVSSTGFRNRCYFASPHGNMGTIGSREGGEGRAITTRDELRRECAALGARLFGATLPQRDGGGAIPENERPSCFPRHS